MTEQKEQLVIPAIDGYPREIGAALWRMQDARSRTLETVKPLTQEVIDWQAPGLQNSIGTLLYHIAAIEMDWLFEEVLQCPWPPEIEALFPHPVRDEDGRLYPVVGVSLEDHLARFDQTRRCLLDSFKGMTEADYVQARSMPRYDVTPEWVLHHLARHEAEHRGEMMTIVTLGGF